MENTYIYNKIKSVEEKYTKKITGGRLNGMTDIKPQWRFQKMTEIFGACGIGWYYEETRREYKEYDGQVAVFIDINLYFRFPKIDEFTDRVVGHEWSKPIHGTGGSMFVAKEIKGMYVSDEAVKMALTDALSVAMKAIGMAADIYMGMPATKYDITTPQPPAKKDVTDFEAMKKAVENGVHAVDKLARIFNLTAEQITELKQLETLKKVAP